MNIAPFNVEVESLDGGVGALSISGELDQSTAAELREPLHEAINTGAGAVMIDMTKCGFIDSTGLGVLVEGLKRVKTRGGEFSIVATQDKILKIFDITGLNKEFLLRGSVEDALGSSAPSSAPTAES